MEPTTKKRKHYKIAIDPNLQTPEGVEKVSLVKQPAIEVNWVAFSKQLPETLKFQAEPDKRLLSGPFMIPDIKISRRDDDLGEYDVSFTPEVIELAMNKFFRNSSKFSINVEHTDQIVNAYIVEHWTIADPNNDKSNTLGFSNLPKGTSFGTVFIEDEAFWNDYIKTGKVKGFSVEGMMKLALSKLDFKQINQTIMSQNTFDFSTLKKRNFATAKTADGLTIQTVNPDDKFEASVAVVAVDDQGATYDLADGDYTLEDGNVITVKAGVIDTLVVPTEQAADPNAEAPAVDFQAALDAMKVEIVAALTELSDRITALETEETTESADDMEMSSMKAEIASIKEGIAKFSKLPAAKPLNKEVVSTPAALSLNTQQPLKVSSLVEKVK